MGTLGVEGDTVCHARLPPHALTYFVVAGAKPRDFQNFERSDRPHSLLAPPVLVPYFWDILVSLVRSRPLERLRFRAGSEID